MTPYIKTFTVEPSDIDINGHVGNIRYLEWFIQSATEHSESVGLGFETLKAQNRSWIVKEHHIEYKNGAFLGEALSLRTWIESVKVAQSVRRYELLADATGKVICTGYTTWVFVEYPSLRPARIPHEMIELYTLHLSE
ncbi:MAG: hypothetical protein KU37_00120 [Sulfuricurvum sp. PC08-66]|nr:MAG: hypothetical protein KU37_00120 [Sulfuricurvum sp. PC08-66]